MFDSWIWWVAGILFLVVFLGFSGIGEVIVFLVSEWRESRRIRKYMEEIE